MTASIVRKALIFIGMALPLGLVSTATAQSRQTKSLEVSQLDEDSHPNGYPQIHLDSLSFPKDVVGAKGFEQHLRKVLKREAYRADWGAGSGNRIEYRFNITELRFTVSGSTMRVHCSATGKLPGGKHAKSDLSFGGHLSERTQLTKRVLEIVARGVITRLAQLERIRRGLQ